MYVFSVTDLIVIEAGDSRMALWSRTERCCKEQEAFAIHVDDVIAHLRATSITRILTM